MEGALLPCGGATPPTVVRAAADADELAAAAAARAARAAIEADIVFETEAVPPDVDGANVDTLIMRWRDFGPWRQLPRRCSALDSATLLILRAAWDAADLSPDRTAIRIQRHDSSRERSRVACAAAGHNDSERRVRQRRDDDEQRRRHCGARARHPTAHARTSPRLASHERASVDRRPTSSMLGRPRTTGLCDTGRRGKKRFHAVKPAP